MSNSNGHKSLSGGGENLSGRKPDCSSTPFPFPTPKCGAPDPGALPHPRTLYQGKRDDQFAFSASAAGWCLFVGIPFVIGLALLLAKINGEN